MTCISPQSPPSSEVMKSAKGVTLSSTTVSRHLFSPPPHFLVLVPTSAHSSSIFPLSSITGLCITVFSAPNVSITSPSTVPPRSDLYLVSLPLSTATRPETRAPSSASTLPESATTPTSQRPRTRPLSRWRSRPGSTTSCRQLS